VRKIISILVTVGLVLAFSVVAVPTTGAACNATVALSNDCAGHAGTVYTIDFTAPVTLLPVNDMISVEFGAGTTFSFSADADITVEVNGGGANPVDDIDAVVVTGTRIEFAVPAATGTIFPGDSVELVISKVANPGVAGDYELTLDYDLACCAGVTFDCADYTIVPAISTYGFFWDSSPTYDADIAFDFVPPFKVCGQDEFPGEDVDGKWLNYFDLYLMPIVVGCAGPCGGTNVSLTLTLTAAPAGSNVTLDFDGTIYSLLIDDDTTTEVDLGTVLLGANDTIVWNNAIHFDAVGDYEICVDAICPGGAPVCPDCTSEDTVVASKCFDVKVYQHKTAVKIALFRKWNLISLPLVPLEDPNPIEDVLAAYSDPDMILSIYYYDRCTDTWSVWGNGQSSLATLEDGKSYWVKVEYSHTVPALAPGTPVPGLWVWGTPQPVPPNSPASYPVCDGWNMVGLTGYDDGVGAFTPPLGGQILDSAYFWNLTYGQIYAWDGANQMWESELGNLLADNQVGEGYWISVAGAGTIYPP
jgi:hypothetical protein